MDKTVKILVIIFALSGAALFGYHQINQWHNKSLERAVDVQKQDCTNQISHLEVEVNKLAEALEIQQQQDPKPKDLKPVFGSKKPETFPESEKLDCEKNTAQVAAFFQYLDSKSYLIRPGINIQAEELFDEILVKLAAKPPINVGEMNDLHSMIGNVSHFYRLLGKDQVALVKEILSTEASVLEPAMSVIFSWMTVCRPKSRAKDAQPSLQTMYEYACFFLNTFGGRSYLMRRDSNIRMLVNYYSLLIIDMANAAKINKYGLDIRTHLDYLFYDISNQKNLMYHQRYLTQLSVLKDKYQ
ncbi:MAG: hypothetical protein GY874_04885 [Desulfobacteraceae bacterium]|nr:hypothetical protein [Desulfobacteraceae bacterium]